MKYFQRLRGLARLLAEYRVVAAAGAAGFVFAFSASAFESAASERLAEAQKEVFADRFENASSLYAKLLEEQPEQGDAWYGLVRAEIAAHHSGKASAAAEQALAKAPHTAGAETAAGLAMFRRGDFSNAESHFRAALAIKPDHPGALQGIASLFYSVSRPKTGRDLVLRAYRQAPDDPRLMAAYANTLKGPEHIAALEAVLAKIDPASEQAKNLRVHIANDRALGDRKLRRLVSPYETSRIKLSLILDGPSRPRGWGLRMI